MVSKCFKATLKQASLGFTGRLPIQRSTCPQATPLATDLRSLLNTKPYSLFGRLSCAEFDAWNVTSMSSRAHAWPAQVYFVFPTCACPLIIVLLYGAICVLHVQRVTKRRCNLNPHSVSCIESTMIVVLHSCLLPSKLMGIHSIMIQDIAKRELRNCRGLGEVLVCNMS